MIGRSRTLRSGVGFVREACTRLLERRISLPICHTTFGFDLRDTAVPGRGEMGWRDGQSRNRGRNRDFSGSEMGLNKSGRQLSDATYRFRLDPAYQPERERQVCPLRDRRNVFSGTRGARGATFHSERKSKYFDRLPNRPRTILHVGLDAISDFDEMEGSEGRVRFCLSKTTSLSRASEYGSF